MKFKLKKMVRWFLNRKIVDLNNDGKIDSLHEEVADVFSQFKRAYKKLEDVNGQLDVIVNEEIAIQDIEREMLEEIIANSEALLAESEERISKAEKEKQTNQKLQQKVQEFII